MAPRRRAALPRRALHRSPALTPDEIALYDRQIRLWGMATQLRLRAARVLVVNLGAVGTEVVKNLVIGGLNQVEILDSAAVREEDFGAQFFLPNDALAVGQLRAPLCLPQIRALNPRAAISVSTTALARQPRAYFAHFDLVVATELLRHDALALNDTTRALGLPLYVAGVHGMCGYVLTDLIRHELRAQRDAGNQPRRAGDQLGPNKTIAAVEYDAAANRETVTVVDDYVPLAQLWALTRLARHLTRRQLKRMSPALPLVLALFEVERPPAATAVCPRRLRELALAKCRQLDIPALCLTTADVARLAAHAFAEFAPVAAVLGGCLAQDVIQFLSKRDSPINNCLVLDAVRSEMPVYLL